MTSVNVPDFLHCNKCCRADGGAKYIITNCGHIFCNFCINGNFCPLCQKPIQIMPYSANMKGDMKDYFTDLQTHFRKWIKIDAFQKKHYKTKFDNCLSRIEKLTNENKKLREDNGQLMNQVTSLQEQLNSRPKVSNFTNQIFQPSPEFCFDFTNGAGNRTSSQESVIEIDGPTMANPMNLYREKRSAATPLTDAYKRMQIKPEYSPSNLQASFGYPYANVTTPKQHSIAKTEKMQGRNAQDNRAFTPDRAQYLARHREQKNAAFRHQVQASPKGPNSVSAHFAMPKIPNQPNRITMTQPSGQSGSGNANASRNPQAPITPVRSYFGTTMQHNGVTSPASTYFSAASSYRSPVPTKKKVSVAPFSPEQE